MTDLDATLADIRGRADKATDSAGRPTGFGLSLIADVPRLLAAVDAALKVADDGEHGALRWQDPLPVPEYVHLIRAAVAAALTCRHLADPKIIGTRKDPR